MEPAVHLRSDSYVMGAQTKLVAFDRLSKLTFPHYYYLLAETLTPSIT